MTTPEAKETPQQSSGQVMARGAVWTAMGEWLSALASLASAIIAARLLSPDDFGVVGVALLLLRIVQALSQTGFDRALVQRRDADEMLNVGWTFQLLRGLGLGSLIVLAAYPTSVFYGDHRLIAIVAVMSLSVYLQGFRNIAQVLFNRKLNFRALFFVNLARASVSLAISIPAIFYFQNAWALVVGHVGAALVELIVTYVAHPFRPRLEFNLNKAKELFSFGRWVAGTNLIALVVTRGDDLVVSKILGTAALGVYTLAYEISNLPATQVTHTLGKVAFPVYSKLFHSGDREELKTAFSNTLRTALTVTAPLSILLAASAEDLVHFVLGSQWTEAIALIHVLIMAGFARSINATGAALFHAAGLPKYDFRMNLPRLVIIVGLTWPACVHYGLLGACFVVLFAVTSTLPIWLMGVRAVTGLSVWDLLKSTRTAWAASFVLGSAFALKLRYFETTSLWSAIGALIGVLSASAALMKVLEMTTSIRLYADVRALVKTFKTKRPSALTQTAAVESAAATADGPKGEPGEPRS